MNEVLIDFREDLRNGVGLWDCLSKYNLTLKQALDGMDKPFTKVRKRGVKPKNIKSRYIYKNGRHYVVQKTVKCHTGNYGTYTTLEEAEMVRDYFAEHGWEHERLDEVCSILGVERRRR
jgi:hypothetical protein